MDDNITGLINQAITLSTQGKLTQAIELYQRVLAADADNFDALQGLGIVHYQKGNIDDALRFITLACTIRPDNYLIHYNQGKALEEMGRYPEAWASYNKAISIQPQFVSAYYNRGLVLQKLKSHREALASYDQAIALKPDRADLYSSRCVAFVDLGRYENALASCDQAITLRPDFADAWSNRGIVLRDLKRYEDALASCDQAIALKPDLTDGYNNQGNALLDLKRLTDALVSYDKALACNPDYAEAYNNRGNALTALKRLDEAVASFDKALVLKPDYAEAYNNWGNALLSLKRLDEALVKFNNALALKPGHAEAYNNRGNALTALKRLDEAVVNYDQALVLKSDFEFLFGMYVYTKMWLGDWASLDVNRRRLIEDISRSFPVATPFTLLGLVDSPEVQLTAAKVYVNTKHPKWDGSGAGKKRRPDGKIRIGYYSPDFREHAVSCLTAELFEVHDRTRFDIYGFSFGAPAGDLMHQRVSAAFDRFIDINAMSDGEVVSLSRDLGIDIAVDLAGFTKDSRIDIFAGRAAPVQVNFLGHPGSMGAEYIDYIIADRTVIPPECQTHYTEKVVYLPHSYQVNDSQRKISDRVFSKRELGLPETGFVFRCLNNTYKILPATFDGWMRILTAVPGSVLWLLADHPTAEINLRRAAEARGVAGSRLCFAQRIAKEDYLARFRVGDLMLDTFPFNSCTTASDALWAGLPILTRMGRSFVSRMAASLLNAMELPELITRTQEDYEARAIELATNPEMLRAIKNTLARNRLTTPLFDGTVFARHIDAAYAAMYARLQAGLAPDTLEF